MAITNKTLDRWAAQTYVASRMARVDAEHARELTRKRRSLLKIRPGDVVRLHGTDYRVVRFDAENRALHLAPATVDSKHAHMVVHMGERTMIERYEPRGYTE